MTPASKPDAQPLLKVRDLKVEFASRNGTVTALDGVSFDLHERETLCIVGESGCGKSITALALMGLVADPPGRVAGGSIRLEGRELLTLSPSARRATRGRDMAMIFQEPMTSLNPVFPVGDQIAEAIELHQPVTRREARDRAVELLKKVGIPDPARRAKSYPHELSGGMRQRVMIAMAISCRPRILIADEPTTALDVTVQARVFDLLRALQEEFGIAILMITHDMGAVAEMADRVAVMYAGRFVEEGSVDAVLDSPLHPYTRGLIDCIPALGKIDLTQDRPQLNEIPGVVPPLHLLGRGCAFAGRCPVSLPLCDDRRPAPTSASRRAACHLVDGEAA